MSHPRVRVVVLTLFVVAVAACSSSSAKSALPTSTQDSTTSVESSTTDSSEGDPTTTIASATTVATTATATTKPATATTTKATVAPTTGAPSGPKVATFSVSNPFACIAPDVSFDPPPNMVTVTWTATGADSVYVAIDNPDGPWETGLPTTGSIEIPFACPGPHSYYVVAVKGNQEDVRVKQVG